MVRQRLCVGGREDVWVFRLPNKCKVGLVMYRFEGTGVVFALELFQTGCGLLHPQIDSIARQLQFSTPRTDNIDNSHFMI